MSETDNLKTVRQGLLEALDDRTYSTEDLNAILAEARDKVPGLLVQHDNFDGYAVNEDKLIWHRDNFRYYLKQKKAAKDNFSEARWQHLLAMRTHFRQNGYEGFLPKQSDPQANHTYQPPPKRSRHMYQPSEDLKRYVEADNLNAVRVLLRVDEISNMHLSQQDLIEAAEWIKAYKPEIFAPYEEKRTAHSINPNRAYWTVDYYDQQMVRLENNFSEKRFLHVLEVREHLRQQSVPGFVLPKNTPKAKIAKTSEDASGTANLDSSRSYMPNDDSTNPALQKILMLGGALAVLLVLLLSLGK